jgi:hypothetical protein
VLYRAINLDEKVALVLLISSGCRRIRGIDRSGERNIISCGRLRLQSGRAPFEATIHAAAASSIAGGDHLIDVFVDLVST